MRSVACLSLLAVVCEDLAVVFGGTGESVALIKVSIESFLHDYAHAVDDMVIFYKDIDLCVLRFRDLHV